MAVPPIRPLESLTARREAIDGALDNLETAISQNAEPETYQWARRAAYTAVEAYLEEAQRTRENETFSRRFPDET